MVFARFGYQNKTGPDRKKLDRRNARQQPIKFKDSGFRTGKMLQKKIIDFMYLIIFLTKDFNKKRIGRKMRFFLLVKFHTDNNFWIYAS